MSAFCSDLRLAPPVLSTNKTTIISIIFFLNALTATQTYWMLVRLGKGYIDTSAFCSALRLAPRDLSRNKTISNIIIHFYHFKLSSLVSMTTVSTPALALGYLDTCALNRKAPAYEMDYRVAVEMLR